MHNLLLISIFINIFFIIFLFFISIKNNFFYFYLSLAIIILTLWQISSYFFLHSNYPTFFYNASFIITSLIPFFLFLFVNNFTVLIKKNSIFLYLIYFFLLVPSVVFFIWEFRRDSYSIFGMGLYPSGFLYRNIFWVEYGSNFLFEV